MAFFRDNKWRSHSLPFSLALPLILTILFLPSFRLTTTLFLGPLPVFVTKVALTRRALTVPAWPYLNLFSSFVGFSSVVLTLTARSQTSWGNMCYRHLQIKDQSASLQHTRESQPSSSDTFFLLFSAFDRPTAGWCRQPAYSASKKVADIERPFSLAQSTKLPSRYGRTTTRCRKSRLIWEHEQGRRLFCGLGAECKAPKSERVWK